MAIVYGLLLAGVLYLALGLMAVFQHKRGHAVRYFLVTLLGAALWSFGVAVFLSTDSMTVAEHAAITYYIAAALIASMTFLMGLSLNRSAPLSPSNIVIGVVPFAGLALTLLIAPSILLSDVHVSEGSTNEVILATWPYAVYCVYFIIFFGAGIVAMVQGIQKTSTRSRARKRLQYMIGAYLTAGVIGMWFNLLLPLLGEYRFIWAGPLGALVFVPVAYMTIVKFGLFDVKQTAARTTVYALTLSVLLGIYIAATSVMTHWVMNSSLVPEKISGDQTSIVNIVVTLGLVLLFQPIKRFFDRATNSLFYRRRYSREAFFARLSSVLARSIELQPLLRRAATVISETMGAEQVFFAVPDGVKMLNVGTKKCARLARTDFDVLAQYYQTSRQSGEALIIRRTSEIDKDERGIARLMRSYGVQMALILRSDDEVRGIVCIGERRSGRYTARDFSVLSTIADELTIAVQNAMSLREVRLLNETLQQRVDDATKELRATNAQLRKLDEAKDEFISMASHQLRTPLTSIKGYVDMMLDGDAGKITAMQKQFLTEAYVSSERMVHLINDFLSVSRLQTGRFMIEKRPVNLAKVIEQELESLRVNASGRGLRFAYTPPKNIPRLMLDEAKIQQVVMNFADNAIYYSKVDTVINVKLDLQKDDVVFTVKDTGIGVPKAEQAKLFSKFFRATNARKQRPDGTGVGLYLAKRVIAGHGGEIIFSSTEGKGSTFGFRLPLKALRARDDADKLKE